MAEEESQLRAVAERNKARQQMLEDSLEEMRLRLGTVLSDTGGVQEVSLLLSCFIFLF
jgi:hypothetical protein